MYGQCDDMDWLVKRSHDGVTFGFYGVNDVRFMLDEKVYRAVEDENDGYRSLLGTVEDDSGDLFVHPGKPFADVCVVMYDDSYVEGYALVDVEDGHVWLTIGTNMSDPYYPQFVFDYQPKSPKEGSNG